MSGGEERTTYRWVGRDRSGTARTGVDYIEDLSGFVEAKWRAGWDSLVVTRGGYVVGSVCAGLSGKRTWWIDSGPSVVSR